MGKIIDLTNERFGRLTVIKRGQAPKGRREAYWECVCDCGNTHTVAGHHLRKGKIQSCGCLQKEVAAKLCKEKAINYTNKKIGRLFIIEKIDNQWKCKCDCGKENVFVTSKYLQSSPECSCGCAVLEKQLEKTGSKYNLVGQKFGKLVVIEETPLRNNSDEVLWKCKCDCGEETLASTSKLLLGRKKSCGCLKSYGELLIKTILQENNISYIYQKTFDDCLLPSGKKAIFDFYLTDYKTIIEYDGIQHFFATGGWNTEEKVALQQKYDDIKNNYCIKNNITIIRIPYTETILELQDLLPEKSNFIIGE